MKIKNITILIFLTIFISLVFSQVNAEGKSLFFVVDVSGSMQKNDLFSRLKDEIKTYIKEESNKGDWVSIITFGTDIKVITSEYIRDEKVLGDTNSLIRKIDKLDAKEQYTFMTGAIDILASQMGIAQKANPDHIVKAFIFTDGKNDPPPQAEGANWTFEEILNKHYDIFDNPSTYLYILTLGIKPDESLVKALKNKKRAYINEVPDVEKIEIPKKIEEPEPKKEIETKEVNESKIKIKISGPKKISPGDNVEYPLVLKIKETNDEALDKKFHVDLDLEPSTEFSLDNNEITVKKGLKEKLLLILNQIEEGDYIAKVTFDSDTITSIIPKSFDINFRVKKFNPVPLIILGAILLIAVLLFFYFKSIPTFSDDFIVVNTRENVEYELKDKQKFYSSSVSSKDLEIFDADFKLNMDKKTGDVIAKVIIDGEETEKILKSGDMIIDPYKFEIRMI